VAPSSPPSKSRLHGRRSPFVGGILVGAGLGILLGDFGAWHVIGIGAGFILMALIAVLGKSPRSSGAHAVAARRLSGASSARRLHCARPYGRDARRGPGWQRGEPGFPRGRCDPHDAAPPTGVLRLRAAGSGAMGGCELGA
jgi:hypothetical protein